MKKIIRAVFRFKNEEMTMRNRTTFAIDDNGGDVTVIIRALARVRETNAAGRPMMQQKQIEDSRTLAKDAPISALLGCINELLEANPEIVDKR